LLIVAPPREHDVAADARLLGNWATGGHGQLTGTGAGSGAIAGPASWL